MRIVTLLDGLEDNMHDFVEQLKKLHNEDETEWLATRRKILDYYFGTTADPEIKELLYDAWNRLSKEIEESAEREKDIL